MTGNDFETLCILDLDHNVDQRRERTMRTITVDVESITAGRRCLDATIEVDVDIDPGQPTTAYRESFFEPTDGDVCRLTARVTRKVEWDDDGEECATEVADDLIVAAAGRQIETAIERAMGY